MIPKNRLNSGITQVYRALAQSAKSLMPQRFDRVEARRAGGGVDAEDYADQDADEECQRDRPGDEVWFHRLN